MLKDVLRRTIRQTGFDIVRLTQDEREAVEPLPPDISDEDKKIINFVKPFTMTSVERLISLIDAVRYLSKNRIPGAIAECGVWKGGSMMAVAKTLESERDAKRELFLYDTFEGMSEPTAVDKSYDDVPAEIQLAETPVGEGVWCYSSLDEVKANVARAGYPSNLIHFVKGKVEDTIPANNPPELALLRLDTDWYESTRHELEHLFPLLTRGGILIIDDYGHWQGARRAVDEYLAAQTEKYFLHRIDCTGRMLVKC